MKVEIAVVAALCCALLTSSCKKEEEDQQAFVKKNIIGSWPIKYRIQTTVINGEEQLPAKGDTLIVYNPVDTLIFTPEGQAITRNKTVSATVNYSISADGESITFQTNPVKTQRITFLRNTSLGLGISETDTQAAGRAQKIVIADHLIKN